MQSRDLSEWLGSDGQRGLLAVRTGKVSDRPGDDRRGQLRAVRSRRVPDRVWLARLCPVSCGQVSNRPGHVGPSQLLAVRPGHVPVRHWCRVGARMHRVRGWQVPDGLPDGQRGQLQLVLGWDVRERIGVCQLQPVLGWHVRERSWLDGVHLV